MQVTRPFPVHFSSYPQSSLEVGVIIPILQMKKPRLRGVKLQSYVLSLENHAPGTWLCKVGRAWLGGHRRPVLESDFNSHFLGNSVQVSAPSGASISSSVKLVTALNQKFLMQACGWEIS